jgi:enolase
MLLGWIAKYPIVSIEDPLAEDDPEGFARFTQAIGDRLQIVGDDFLVSSSKLIREAANIGAANTVLLKPNQRGTLSETLEAWKVAQELGYAAIVSARSGETEDTTIVDLAIGWNVGQLKVGLLHEASAWQSGTTHCVLRKSLLEMRTLQAPPYLENKKRALLLFNLGFGNDFLPALDIGG